MISSILILFAIAAVIDAEVIAVSPAPPAFSGIGFWFYTDADGTNGNPWCGYPYNDGMPIFAPVSFPEHSCTSDYMDARRLL